jgi:nicotinamide-nucleotide amidase
MQYPQGKLADFLVKKGWLMATAESCTGGMIAAACTDLAGSSAWFERGFVTYSNAAKRRQLGVSSTTLAQHGAVSEQVVLEMVVGALVASSAQLAVGISGVAGPDGGTEQHPVGEVWFGRAIRQQDDSVGALAVRRRFTGDRDAVRRHSAAFALQLLLDG